MFIKSKVIAVLVKSGITPLKDFGASRWDVKNVTFNLDNYLY